MDFERLMHTAIMESKKSGIDVPVGALIVDKSGKIISLAHNQKEFKTDPTSHAEIEAIRAAGEKLGDWRLEGCTLVVTLEPCVMCAGAIVAARIERVVFGAWDPRVGAVGSLYDIVRDIRLGNPVEVFGGVSERECSALLASFFARNRDLKSSADPTVC